MPTPPILMPLWPRPAASETLEWLTYAMISENGTEERSEMRDTPRQSFNVTYYAPPSLQPRINNILYGGRTLQWSIPVWPQAQHIGAVAPGATALTCETRYSEFRDGSNVLIWESPTSYQIVESGAVTSDTNLDLAAPTLAFADAWLMPARKGYLPQDPVRHFNGNRSTLDMSYVVEDNAELSPAAPTQYLGLDLYTDPGLLDGGELTEQVTARFDLYDESLGPVEYRAPWIYKRPARVHRMMGEDAAGTWAIREFLHRRRGRSVAFWLPSFENDLRVNDAGAIAAALTVHADDYIDNAAARNHVAIETPAGWLARHITSATVIGTDQTQLVFDSSLGGIDAATIKRVSFLGQRRLDTDRVEIKNVGSTVNTCAVNTVEIAP